MHRRPERSLTVMLIRNTALITAILFASAAATAGGSPAFGTQKQIESLNAVLDVARTQRLQATDTLIDRVYARGRLPVIVRLKNPEQPYGLFSDRSRPQGEAIKGLQSLVLDDILAQTTRDETELHVKRFQLIPAMALLADAAALEALLANPDVVDIIEDIPVPPALQDSVPLIGAGPDGSFSGYTGQGQTVAILDTGVDKNHPFLSGKVVSEACYSNSYGEGTSLCPGGVKESTSVGSGLPCNLDQCDHGTHVAGIAAGNGPSFAGVAKDAHIIAIQVFTGFGSTIGSYTADQISGLERVYALRNTYSIASANMSLGGTTTYAEPCNNEPLKPYVDTLRTAGIATVISSGNNSSKNALSSPGCIGSAVSVGSTTKTDVVSEFSNSADFLALLAPGSTIQSSVPGSYYLFKSGTSMAAPHVAGAWAILKQAKPKTDVSEVLGALQFNGVPITDTRINAGDRVKPRIELQDALNSLLAPGSWIRWDDGVQIDAIEDTGFALSVASRWQPEDIPDNRLITKIRVGVYDVPTSAVVKIWQGNDPATMELQYSQAFTPAAQQLNEIVLDTPYVIDDSKDLFVGWSATHSAGQSPYALDADTNTNQQGNLSLWFDGIWRNLSLSGDWIIHAFLEGKCFEDDDCIDEKPFCVADGCVAGGYIQILKSTVKAGKIDNTDSMQLSGLLDATEADLEAAMGGDVIVSIKADEIPDLEKTKFTFPVDAFYFDKGKYTSPKDNPLNKADPVKSFTLDTNKGTMKFSAKNIDLTGMRCPITFRVEIGDYAAAALMDEQLVNGEKKPCPLPLMMGVHDSLNVTKIKAKKSTADDSDSISMSGTFTIDGDFDTNEPLIIKLGADTFTVPGEKFAKKNGSFSCKSVASGAGFVTAKFDTIKCTYSISINNAALSDSGDVDFGLDIFDNHLQASTRITLPPDP